MGLLTPCSVQRGGFLYTMNNDCTEGRVLLSSSRVCVCVRGGGGGGGDGYG